ncbi:MAG: hypothetical protein ACYTFA_12425 [Planctomycetota bacterium]|jgi:hypothetical protein
MTVETTKLSVPGIPVEDLDYLRPFAKRAGHSDVAGAAVVRWAVIDLAKRLQEEAKQAAAEAAKRLRKESKQAAGAAA